MAERRRVYYKPKGGSTFTEITNYVVKSGNLKLHRARKRSEGGNIQFDDLLPVTIEPHDEVKITIDDGTTEEHLFSGLFIPQSTQITDLFWKFEGYNRLLKKRRVSGVYLQKTRREVLVLILQELFPELTFDETSFPVGTTDEDLEVLDHRFNSKIAAEIFDRYAEDLGRVWFIDKLKKCYVITEEFPENGFTLTDQHIQGKLRKNYDISRWCTLAEVEGESTEVVEEIEKTGSEVIGASNVITLLFSPHTVEVKQIPTGQTAADVGTLRGSIVGGNQDPDRVDFYYNPRAKTITFTDNVTISASDTLLVRQTGTSRITSKQINPIAYANHGLVETNPFVNKLITSQTQADDIAQSRADKFGDPLEIYTANVSWSSNLLPGWTINVNAPTNKLVKNGVKTMEFSVSWNDNSLVFNALLNNVNLDAVDAFEQLNLRVRQLEEKESKSDQFVDKIILWYSNLAVEIYRVRILKYDIGNAFRFDEHTDIELRAQYKFNDDVTDSSGNGFHGTNDGVSFTAGKIANAGDFESTDTDYVLLPASNSLVTDNNAWSICAWFNAESISSASTGNKIVTLHRSSTPNGAISLCLGQSSNVRYEYYNGAGYTATTIQAVSTGTWYHFVMTWDGTSYRAYINGALIRTDAATFAGFGSEEGYIGCYENGNTHFDGLIDDVRIYNGVLELEDVQAIYNSGSGDEDIQSSHSNFDNPNRYVDGVNGSGSLTFIGSLDVYNPARKIKIFFNDADEWDTTLSTATLNVDDCEVTF